MNQEPEKQKMRIAVLMGGASHERETSLESGRNVTYKLCKQKYEIIPLFISAEHEIFKISPSLLVRNSTKEIASLITQDMHIKWNDLPCIADFVFIGLHGGVGENGSVQGALEIKIYPTMDHLYLQVVCAWININK
jgi:D-alanine-D-alanine ligase